MKPEFADCADCGRRIARLGDRERWHHIDRTIGHGAMTAPHEAQSAKPRGRRS